MIRSITRGSIPKSSSFLIVFFLGKYTVCFPRSCFGLVLPSLLSPLLRRVLHSPSSLVGGRAFFHPSLEWCCLPPLLGCTAGFLSFWSGAAFLQSNCVIGDDPRKKPLGAVRGLCGLAGFWFPWSLQLVRVRRFHLCTPRPPWLAVRC